MDTSKLDEPTHLPFATRMSGVEGSAIREMIKLSARPGIISFAGGVPAPELFDLEGLEQAAQQAFGTSATTALQYGATEGLTLLRERLCELMGSRGMQPALENLMVTTGSQQGIDLVGKVLLDPGDAVLLEQPTYLSTIQIMRLHQAKLIGIPLDAQGVVVEALERLIIEHRPKLIYLVPTFANPSGKVLPLERRRRVLELIAQYKVFILEDDPYSELYFDQPSPHSLIALSQDFPQARPYLIHTSSLSKIVSPGLRVGWIVASNQVLSRVVIAKQGADAHSSTLAQTIAAHYLHSGRLGQRLTLTRSAYRQRAAVMQTALIQHLGQVLEFDPPSGGMFIWARFKDGRDAGTTALKAVEHNVTFVPGESFFPTHPDRSTLRLSFATPTPQQIEQGVRQLTQAL